MNLSSKDSVTDVTQSSLFGSTVFNGNLFSTARETKGHKGKKPKKHPLCAFVTVRGKGFPARNGRAAFFYRQGKSKRYKKLGGSLRKVSL
ncbi:hypothetical protein FBQ99_12730 [Chloroflexi bacterium CFX2]|nr:hypothetical protein [Chloroflexi bacterium CFX2]